MSDIDHASLLPRRMHGVAAAVTASLCAALIGFTSPTAAAGSTAGAQPLAGSAQAAEIAQPTLVSSVRPVSRLVQSTGNLYWTVNNPHNLPGYHLVYRESKLGVNGDGHAIYLTGVTGTLGAVTFAKVSGQWRFYVVTTDPSGTARIKQLPSTPGGSATTVATLPGIGRVGDLVTDGNRLYWADARGVRSVSVYGGPVRTLVTASSVAKVSLSGNYLYFASGRNVLRTNKLLGGLQAVARSTSGTVTDLDVFPTSIDRPTVYWGTAGGNVQSQRVGSSVVNTYWAYSGRRVNSVAFDGRRVIWSDCGVSNCAVRWYHLGFRFTVPSGAATGVHDLQGDSAGMYWADSAGVKRFSF
jgi:hypothetical protein